MANETRRRSSATDRPQAGLLVQTVATRQSQTPATHHSCCLGRRACRLGRLSCLSGSPGLRQAVRRPLLPAVAERQCRRGFARAATRRGAKYGRATTWPVWPRKERCRPHAESRQLSDYPMRRCAIPETNRLASPRSRVGRHETSRGGTAGPSPTDASVIAFVGTSQTVRSANRLFIQRANRPDRPVRDCRQWPAEDA